MTSRYNHSSEENEPSPADDFFPPIHMPEEPGAPVEEAWVDVFTRVTGQIIAAAVISAATIIILLLCIGGVWWTAMKIF